MAKKKTEKTPRTARGYRHTDKISLAEDQLNFDEQKVLKVLRSKGEGIAVAEIARAAFPQVRPKARPPSQSKNQPPAYRRVLNALRRLVAADHVQKDEPGVYSAVKKRSLAA